MDDTYDVCIVGAGASGLQALKQLHEYNNDYRVCIIEGRDRIGGRCYTDPVCGDIGGAWIHGENNLLYHHHHHHNHRHNAANDNSDTITIIPIDYDNRIVYDLRINAHDGIVSNDILNASKRDWECIQSIIIIIITTTKYYHHHTHHHYYYYHRHHYSC